MKTIGIAMLTSGDDRKFLQRTIESFLENCSYRPLHFAIFDNASTDDTWQYLNSLKSTDLITYDIKRSEINTGCGIGVNAANNMVREFEYVLFLENDWTHISEKESGASKEWLHECVDLLETNKTDYIFLRRFRHDNETRFHQWQNIFSTAGQVDGNFIEYNNFPYSNNPHIRRNNALYDAQVLPLKEFTDNNGNPTEHKGNKDWGRAEIETKRVLRTMLYKFGMFCHECEKSPENINIIGCGNFERCGASTCKYGFLDFRANSSRYGNFCDVCDKAKDFHDLKEHDNRFIKAYKNPSLIERNK